MRKNNAKRFSPHRLALRRAFTARDRRAMAAGALAGAAIGMAPRSFYPKPLSGNALRRASEARMKSKAWQGVAGRKEASIGSRWEAREVNGVMNLIPAAREEVKNAIARHGGNPKSTVDFTVNKSLGKDYFDILITPSIGNEQGLKDDVEDIAQRYAAQINQLVNSMEEQRKAEVKWYESRKPLDARAELGQRPPLNAKDLLKGAFTGSSFVIGGTLLGVAAAKAMSGATRKARALIRLKKSQASAARQVHSAQAAQESAAQATPEINEAAERGNRAQRQPGYSTALRNREELLAQLRSLAAERSLTGSQLARLITRATEEGLHATDTGRIAAIINEVKAGNGTSQQAGSNGGAQRPAPATKQGNGPKPRLTRITPEKPLELIRIFQRLGFREDPKRGKGDHHVFVHQSGRIAVIPKHGNDLPVGLVLDILRESSVTREEYLRAKER